MATGWRLVVAAMAAGTLVGCQERSSDGPETTLPLLGPYRDAHDSCQRVGEDAVTSAYLDDSADLIACPVGVAGLSGFGAESGAKSVRQVGHWVLISVPRR